ncbi:AAA family ATPase [Nocardioides ultimimeridianus]
MLRRFESIRDSGIFEDFRWGGSNPDFERINLIYGTNGAGKTSLARALDSLDADSGGFTKVSVRLSDPDRTNERSSSQQYDNEFDRIHVFSEAYVDRSHNFRDAAEIDAVLTLGERTVEDEARIAELKDLIEATGERLATAARTTSAAERALDNEYTAIRDRVVSSLRRAGGEYASNSNYSTRVVRNRFAGSHHSWTVIADRQKDADLNTVNSDERQRVAAKSYSLRVRPELRDEAVVVLTTSPLSVVLDTLEQNQRASSWVDNGRHLHAGLDTCIFCGGPLPEDRKRQIEQHFSDEVEAAQRSVDRLLREVGVCQDALHGLLGEGSIVGSLFEDLRDEFNAAHTAARNEATELEGWLSELQPLWNGSAPTFCSVSMTRSPLPRSSTAPGSKRR